MKIGLTICTISLVIFIYLQLDGVINNGYILGLFIGGIIVIFIEKLTLHEDQK